MVVHWKCVIDDVKISSWFCWMWCCRDIEWMRMCIYDLVCDEIEILVCKLFVVNGYVKEWY